MSWEQELLDEIARVDCCLTRSPACRHPHEECTPMCPCQVRRELHWKPIVKRLLADERKPMECRHPKACLVQREISNIEKNEGPLNDTEYCSVCAERERVREMCAVLAGKTLVEELTPQKIVRIVMEAIRQLDLTKDLAPNTEERQ